MAQQSVLKILEKLISFQSTSHNLEEINKLVDFIETYLAPSGLFIKRLTDGGYPSLLIAAKPMKKYRIIFNAHVDVVPSHDKHFKLTVKDNKAFGRGVFDMKGAGAAMIELFKELAETKTLPDDVALTIVTDEEIGGDHGVGFHLKQNILADFFLAGEPTNLGICTELKGVLWVKIIQRGIAAHGSKPWLGKSANVELAKKITAFYKDLKSHKESVWETTYNLSMMHGGKATNVVADEAYAFFDIRRIASDSKEVIFAKLEKYFPETEITLTADHAPLATASDNTFIQSLQKSIKQATSKSGNIIKETYSSDARDYSARGVPSVNFGPIGGGMHADDEWLNLDSLNTYYTILKDFLLASK